MDIMELGAIGELVGGVAVLVTLIYLAVQVRQANLMSRLDANDKLSDSWNEIARQGVGNMDLFMAGAKGYRDLDPQEQLRFRWHMTSTLSCLENFHAKYDHGVIRQVEWDRQFQVFLWYFSWPGMVDLWSDTRLVFTRPFVELVDSIVEGLADGSIPRPAGAADFYMEGSRTN